MTLEEKNKLISLFMGYEDWPEFNSVRMKHTDGIDSYNHICEYQNLTYHKSWDVLLPVLKHIDELLYASYCDVDTTIQELINSWWGIEHQTLQFTDNQLKFGTDIIEVYDDVIDFINFYNEYTKQ